MFFVVLEHGLITYPLTMFYFNPSTTQGGPAWTLLAFCHRPDPVGMAKLGSSGPCFRPQWFELARSPLHSGEPKIGTH